MTQEQKDKLLKYLCMALPYGVKIRTYVPSSFDESTFIEGHLNAIKLSLFGHVLSINVSATEREDFALEGCKPYLRPMSSMTEEEKEEYYDTFYYEDYGGFPSSSSATVETLEFLLAHHFDFMGLIPMDIAIEVTDGNNPYKE